MSTALKAALVASLCFAGPAAQAAPQSEGSAPAAEPAPAPTEPAAGEPAQAAAPAPAPAPAPAAPAPPAKAEFTLTLNDGGRPGWAKQLREALTGAPGVDGVDVNADRRYATVRYRPAVTNPQTLTALVRTKAELNVGMVKLATFDVKGQLTDNCPVLVRMALERLDGVKTVRASVKEAKAWVEYTEGAVTTAKMVERVKDRVGLDLVLVPGQP